MERYQALALQTRCNAVNGCPDVSASRAKIAANIKRIDGQIAAARAFSGPDVRLIVLPEYFATSYPMGEPIPDWRDKAAFRLDGPEYEQLGEIAQRHKVYLSGNAYEADEHFPDLYFQCSFLLNDSGDLILRYRRLISMYAPTPHDILDRYVDQYGAEALFPVADTPLGRMACIASEEILYPEIARCLAVRGAEILLHSSSELASALLPPKHVAKRARAYENMAYVVSANTAGIADVPMPEMSADGASIVVDYKGSAIAEAASGESMSATAFLDIAALRAYRQRPGMPNILARQRLGLFADTYASKQHYPANNLLGKDGQVIKDFKRSHFVEQQQSVIEKLSKDGII